MIAPGLAIPVLKAVNTGWRDSSSADVADVGRLLDGAELDELRETTRHLALLVVSLASLIEERGDGGFTFDGWIAHQQEWLTLEALEDQFAGNGDAA